MSDIFVVRLALLIVITVVHPLAYSNQQVREGESNITNARWIDYQEEYPTSHLCKVNEVTLWTCETRKKTYSLCSSQEITKETGYIQYRVSDHERVTFKFPNNILPPKDFFQYKSAANGDASMVFHNNGYQYVLVDLLRGNSFIEVWKKEPERRKVADIACSNANQSLQLNYTIKLMQSLETASP